MFERFTDRARRIVVLAQEEARMLRHNYIGTEHLLLGMIHEGQGIAAQVLTTMDVNLQAVRTEIERIVGARSNPARLPHPIHPTCETAPRAQPQTGAEVRTQLHRQRTPPAWPAGSRRGRRSSDPAGVGCRPSQHP